MKNKPITQQELENFFKVMDKYGIPYQTTPRTQEEIDNLNCIYNTINKTIYFKRKDETLISGEKIVSPDELFGIIAGNTYLYLDDTENTLS